MKQAPPPVLWNSAEVRDRIPVKDLHFDSQNPRLVEYNLGEISEPEHIKLLWKRMAVDEVLLSIATDGFWDYEPLIVCKENGKWVVIEGNRRLAAVKIIQSPKLQAELAVDSLPNLHLSDAAKQTLDPLPVIKIAHRQDVWRYLGFKHVNGPAKWRSYARANFVGYVRDELGTSLNDIATQFGDRHRTVQRMYEALLLVKQAEETGAYKRDYAWGLQIPLTTLLEALKLPIFHRFLGLRTISNRNRKPTKPNRSKELGEMCVWLWGDTRGRGTPPMIKNGINDVRRLGQVLADRKALAALNRGADLDVAHRLTDDVEVEAALKAAKVALRAVNYLGATTPRDRTRLLDFAYEATEIARDLVARLESYDDRSIRRRCRAPSRRVTNTRRR